MKLGVRLGMVLAAAAVLVGVLLPVPATAHVSDGRYEAQLGNNNACMKDRSKEGEANFEDPFVWNSYGKAVLFFDGVDVMKYVSHACKTDETQANQKLVVPAGAIYSRGVIPAVWDWEDGAEKTCVFNPGPSGVTNPSAASGAGYFTDYAAPPCGWTVDPADGHGGSYTDYPNYGEWHVTYGGTSYKGDYSDLWMGFGGTLPMAKSSHRFYAADYASELPCVQGVENCSNLNPEHPVPLFASVGSPYLDVSGDLAMDWALPPSGDGNNPNP